MKIRDHRSGSTVVQDETLNWGRSGQTEITPERGAPGMNEAERAATGTYPEPAGQVSTTPDQTAYSSRVEPDLPHGADGNWGMDMIAANTKIGGSK
jgi:hypothetical protein